jgi:hypothetical protein
LQGFRVSDRIRTGDRLDHNQAADLDPRPASPVVWEGFRFRSKVERRMAMALNRAGVMFFPNCKGGLGGPTTE